MAEADRTPAKGKFGDVIVRFVRRAHRRRRTEIESTRGLTGEDRACVERAMQQQPCLFLSGEEQWPVDPFVEQDVALGEPAPAFPPLSAVADRWENCVRGGFFLSRWWACSRLQDQLREDAEVTSKGCLWLPATENLRRAANLWKDGLGSQVAPLCHSC